MPERQGETIPTYILGSRRRDGVRHRERREGAPFISSTQNNSHASMIHVHELSFRVEREGARGKDERLLPFHPPFPDSPLRRLLSVTSRESKHALGVTGQVTRPGLYGFSRSESCADALDTDGRPRRPHDTRAALEGGWLAYGGA